MTSAYARVIPAKAGIQCDKEDPAPAGFFIVAAHKKSYPFGMDEAAEVSKTALPESLEFLLRFAPFNSMDGAGLAFLANHLRAGSYPAGTAIVAPEQGKVDRFHIIKRGAVIGEQDLTDTLRGNAYWIIPAGDSFPLKALLSKSAAAGIYRALEETECLEMDVREFDELCRISLAFREYCVQRVASLTDQSQRILKARRVQPRLDQQPLSSPLSALIQRKPVTCSPGTPVRAVLEAMQREEIGSMVVCDDRSRPLGIFTLHDLLFKVAMEQPDLSQPISGVMKVGLITLPPHALAYEAALEMTRHHIRHILVVDNDQLVGLVSERDLFTLQQVSLRVISGAIRGATDTESLERASRDVRQLAQNMLVQGVAAEQLTQFISTLNDLLTQRIIEVEIAKVPLDGVQFCWIALGSEGRYEQTLNTDQDNGIIFTSLPSQSPEAVRAKLLPLAKRINLVLDECGFPLCKGNIMASNPECCLSLDEWEHKFATWIHRADAPELLNATIFFDFRPLYGASELAMQLREALHARIQQNRLFVRRMVENALNNQPPLGLIREFVVSDREGQPNTIDLKINGVTFFVDAARIFSLATRIDETNTPRRLRAIGKKWQLDAAQVDAWIEAFYFIQLMRMRAQHKQIMQNKPLTNRVDPDTLNELDRRILKESYRQARKIQSAMQKYFQF